MLHHSLVLVAFAAALSAVGVRASAAAGQTPADAQPQTVEAIWKEQQITFYFQSFTSFYSCDGLENKLERVLKALGARAKVRVRAPECPSAVAQMPRVIVEVVSPVLATAEALAEREKGRSTRELAQRVRGKRPQDAAVMENFQAQWQRVSLSRGALNLEPGDCELVDELRRKVLPKLAVRIVDGGVHCTPHQLSMNQPRLHVEALVEAPKPDDRVGK